MKLYLAQHGEALAKEVDPDRPLSAQGRGDVERVAAALAGRVAIARVLHSGKTRARQTAELLGAALAPDRPVQAMEGLAPDDPPAPIARKLSRLTEDTLVVGHLPFMARLVGRLLSGGEERDLVVFRPGSVVCLELADGVSWRLLWMLRPELLAG